MGQVEWREATPWVRTTTVDLTALADICDAAYIDAAVVTNEPGLHVVHVADEHGDWKCKRVARGDLGAALAVALEEIQACAAYYIDVMEAGSEDTYLGPLDHSDDGEALASCGWGTDEDYTGAV